MGNTFYSKSAQEHLSKVKKVVLEDNMLRQVTLVSENGRFFKEDEESFAILMNRGQFDQHVNALVSVHGWKIVNVEYIND